MIIVFHLSLQLLNIHLDASSSKLNTDPLNMCYSGSLTIRRSIGLLHFNKV